MVAYCTKSRLPVTRKSARPRAAVVAAAQVLFLERDAPRKTMRQSDLI
jgi:hypothetical protein